MKKWLYFLVFCTIVSANIAIAEEKESFNELANAQAFIIAQHEGTIKTLRYQLMIAQNNLNNAFVEMKQQKVIYDMVNEMNASSLKECIHNLEAAQATTEETEKESSILGSKALADLGVTEQK